MPWYWVVTLNTTSLGPSFSCRLAYKHTSEEDIFKRLSSFCNCLCLCCCTVPHWSVDEILWDHFQTDSLISVCIYTKQRHTLLIYHTVTCVHVFFCRNFPTFNKIDCRDKYCTSCSEVSRRVFLKQMPVKVPRGSDCRDPDPWLNNLWSSSLEDDSSFTLRGIKDKKKSIFKWKVVT